MNHRELSSRNSDNRVYRNESIEVTWEPDLCIHAAVCVRSLPEVFNARIRPWVDLSAAETDVVTRVVELCPSKALKYRRLGSE